jgi:hypothetical protein
MQGVLPEHVPDTRNVTARRVIDDKKIQSEQRLSKRRIAALSGVIIKNY